jgi:hypothetical protein
MQHAALEKEIRKSESDLQEIWGAGAPGGTGERVAYEPLIGRVDAA